MAAVVVILGSGKWAQRELRQLLLRLVQRILLQIDGGQLARGLKRLLNVRIGGSVWVSQRQVHSGDGRDTSQTGQGRLAERRTDRLAAVAAFRAGWTVGGLAANAAPVVAVHGLTTHAATGVLEGGRHLGHGQLRREDLA